MKKLKEKFRDVAQGGLFGGLLKAEQFVATILPANYDHTVSIAAHFLCFFFCFLLYMLAPQLLFICFLKLLYSRPKAKLKFALCAT